MYYFNFVYLSGYTNTRKKCNIKNLTACNKHIV